MCCCYSSLPNNGQCIGVEGGEVKSLYLVYLAARMCPSGWWDDPNPQPYRKGLTVIMGQ